MIYLKKQIKIYKGRPIDLVNSSQTHHHLTTTGLRLQGQVVSENFSGYAQTFWVKCFQDGASQVSRSYHHGRKWSSTGFEIFTACAYTRVRHERHPFKTLLWETNHKKATSEVWKCPQVVQLGDEEESGLSHGKTKKRNTMDLDPLTLKQVSTMMTVIIQQYHSI